MTHIVGTPINSNDTPILSSTIPLNTTTSSVLLIEQSVGESPRIRVIVQNNGVTPMWVKLQPASVDNIMKGMKIPAGEFRTIIEAPNIYNGEISGIAEVGSPTAYVTSF